MGTKEHNLIANNLLNLDDNERMFRANAGMGWTGKKLKIKPGMTIKIKPGMTILADSRPFRGMIEGFPDVCGWKSIEITPDMIGKKIAVFVGREFKATGKKSKPQEKFAQLLKKMGGIFETIYGAKK